MQRGAAHAFFAPLVEGRTYRAFAYLVLGLPLGVAYFSAIVTMMALGFGLAITIVGLPILALGLRLARGLTAFDLGLTESLLGVDMPRVPVVTASRHGWRRFFGDRDAWVDAAYLLARFPLGLAGCVIAISVVGTAVYFIFLPVVVAAGAHAMDIGSWSVDSQARAWIFVPGGVLLLLLSPHVINGLAFLSVRVSRVLVGRVGYRRLRADILTMLQPDAGLTGPAVLDQLRLYHGASVDCTATNVFVVLRELERAGIVARTPAGELDQYSLA